ncbi:hypothetical protein MSAN_00898800 [Mycena sanguinolenta]|uniref:Uncharacterized protein n=1 Tax=Mycena sanguinolenta TaxID=230812 RepID=A0A8H6YWD7_9AGAR|nr:hypothetical protein MSAN_00898800 [Mycena sanguinolenta]
MKFRRRDLDKRYSVLQVVGAWLSRSGSCPLSLNIHRATAKNLPGILSTIVPHRARWEHVELVIDAHSLLHLFDGAMPLLRHLDLSLSNCKAFELRAIDLPQLRSVKVMDDRKASVVKVTPLPWAQLTSLVLWAVTPSVVASVLHQASRLVRCVLGFRSEQSPFAGVHIILPCLETLALIGGKGNATDLLGNLSAPALRRLEFQEGVLGTDPIRLMTVFISVSVKLQEITIIRGHHSKRFLGSENHYRTTFPSIPTFSFAETNKSYTEY